MIDKNKISCGVVILAAGDSSRMGSVKSFLRFNDEKVFIEKIIDEYLGFNCSKIIIMTRTDQLGWEKMIRKYSGEESVFFVNNNLPELERFYSVKLGIELLGNLNFCFIQNSDNPFVNGNLLNKIYTEKESGDFIIPTFESHGGHPILIGKKIISELKSHLYQGNLRDFLGDFKRFELESDEENILVNINTKEDYREIFERKMDNA